MDLLSSFNILQRISQIQSSWTLLGVVSLLIAAIVTVIRKRFVQAKPNEWLLVIRDGKQWKAGVGMKAFLGFTDSFVKFPSRMERVEFTANNVTKEMQGVVITGFAFWSVFREGDGPFRCHKYMEGGDANRNVQAMCESVLRDLIANSKLEEVLRNRKLLKDNMSTSLKDQFKGWGLWLETVEIKEVKISSDRLFKDLQAEFRLQTQLEAQKIELESQEKMTEMRQSSDLKTASSYELNETKKLTTANNEKIKRQQLQQAYENEKNQLQIAKMARSSKLQIEKLKTNLLEEQEKIQNEQQIAKMKQEFELDYERKKLELEKEHNGKTLLKYQIDATERIYRNLGIREIKINQFTGDSKTSLGALLPQMGYAMEQINSISGKTE